MEKLNSAQVTRRADEIRSEIMHELAMDEETEDSLTPERFEAKFLSRIIEAEGRAERAELKLRAYERAVEHKCRPIGRALMGEGRDWWVGELLEPVKDWPQETHCLHMKTPVKDIVFLCNSGDFSNLLVLCHIILGAKLNQDWIETQMKIMQGKRLRGLENIS